MGKKKNQNPTEESDKPAKKTRVFSAKEFRKELNTNTLASLQQFSKAIKESEEYDYIFEYLECGGNCLELLHSLEVDSAIAPLHVFDLITNILLRINTLYPQYHSSAYESCRYILNNYVTVLNKMINFSSTTPERKSCLKLLTAMVAFSPVLAKDILIHINFHSSNVELLTKHTGEKDSTRDNFIKFLTAYLVDGHYPALSVLLEKKGFFTSIVSGLKFDSADTLCLVVTAMKTFILENPSVSKTAKMKTFNTVVVRDIVNLYNWKGPGGFRAEKKKNSAITVNEVEKSKVNESVHEFLLILCTNHKYGIIFKDPLVGLGKKNQNALMYTVLESLDRPWEHSYASELVTKICGACPDLAKTLWTNLKSYLEPRLSQKWVNAMKFAVNLVKELQPNCLEYCIKDLSDIQLFQVVQCLVLPLPILKTLLPENNTFESAAVKQYVLSLLLEMLRALQEYSTASKRYLTLEKHNNFQLFLNKHLAKNFPNAVTVLKDWEILNDDSPFSTIQLLEIIFDIFSHYKSLSSELLESLGSSDTELSDLLAKSDQLSEAEESLEKLQVKIISVFVDLNQSTFTVSSKMFRCTVPLLLRIYYNSSDAATQSVLFKLLRNTSIFEGCFDEINIWINGVLNLKHFDKSVAENVVDILEITNENLNKFVEELSKMQSENSREKHYEDIFQNLMLKEEVSSDIHTNSIKHRYLSPTVLGLLTFLDKNEPSKAFKTYVAFVMTNLLHQQTQIGPIVSFINKCDALSSSFKEYATNWLDCKEITCLNKAKGRIEVIKEFSEQFLTGDIETFIQHIDSNMYSDLKLNVLDAGIFYTSNLLNNEILTLEFAERFEKFCKSIIKQNLSDPQVLKRILSHPTLANSVNFLNMEGEQSGSYITKVLVNIITYLIDEKCEVEEYLKFYREQLSNSILKVLKKPGKYENMSLELKNLLPRFGLGCNDCFVILRTISKGFATYTQHSLVVGILCYTLNRFAELCTLESIGETTEIILNLTVYFTNLANSQQNVAPLSSVFLEVFKKFHHLLNNVDNGLFKALLQLEDVHKDNTKLLSFLLEKQSSNIEHVKEQLQSVCDKKALLLPLLAVLSKQAANKKFFKKVYDLILPSLNKTLQKPQKVGQHFHEHYQGLVALIKVAMPVENCQQLWEKVQKFDSTEIFHVHLLDAIVTKVLEDSVADKLVNNIIVTFVHLQIYLFKKNVKSEVEIDKAVEVTKVFVQVLKKVKEKCTDVDFKSTANNETVKLYFKFCLKYGVSKQPVFLQALQLLIQLLSKHLEVEDGRLILDMLTSHSEFLETVLGEYCDTKTEILSLYLELCRKWPEFMERHYVPLLLASYRGLVNKCDRIVLLLLKMYASKPDQTHFYDFKPFLWDKAAATHYSVRQQIENALWRQPKTSDVLDILQEHLVHSTITNYPLKCPLRSEDSGMLDVDDTKSYDLTFLLPLFSQLLAPEQHIQTYKFTRSGALSLTIIGLSSADTEIRKAACHVLARLHYHVDARQSGKDNLLWLRYIEAVCKGVALLPDLKLNNFAAIYLARMALILTQPNHVMYLPLSQHLTAKSSLDFSTIPELYTFLHSSDVNYKEHRSFTLELIRDGLRTEKDFADFMRSMAFKLISELYSSVVADYDTRVLILDAIKSICGISLGVKVVCENYSFLTQFSNDLNKILTSTKEKINNLLFRKNLDIVLRILRVAKDRHAHFMIYNALENFFSSTNNAVYWIEGSEEVFFEIVDILFSKYPSMFTKRFYNALEKVVDDPVCNYVRIYNCDFFDIEELNVEDKHYFIRKFFVSFRKSKEVYENIVN
ncbi:nucleolar pre-ribosomal-associated protein 1 [Diabrotica virgifera virgifera]|uniref:Nucleolar pre-ribosomal-associated protein 1 n=1 Tax=Diabrotica virgifera virgifera TaxID=50390 RepID=A0ABM5KF38_DIAVI|nr:nucleolar pre-ribosomal-associated protein 1 [Diabrotica virgifera virgifera]